MSEEVPARAGAQARQNNLIPRLCMCESAFGNNLSLSDEGAFPLTSLTVP